MTARASLTHGARMALLLLGALAGTGARTDAQEGREPMLSWRKRQYPVTELPAELPRAARNAVEAWRAWATDAGYDLELDPVGHLLLIVPAGDMGAKRRKALVEDVHELFEATLPLPADRPEPAPPAAVSSTEEVAPAERPLPEDPDGEEHPWQPFAPEVEVEEPVVDPSLEELARLDVETAVMLLVPGSGAYGEVLQHLVSTSPELAEWRGDVEREIAFVLPWPLVGCALLEPVGMAGWDPTESPEHALVNAVARLLLLRRFGAQPAWFERAWGWYAETELLKGLQVHRRRGARLTIERHDDWDSALQERFKTRMEVPLEAKEFASWQRSIYDDIPAKTSWGMVVFLARHRPDGLRSLVEALRIHRDENDRIVAFDGSWTRTGEFSYEVEDVTWLVRGTCGEDVLEEASAFFRKGKRYRPKKR